MPKISPISPKLLEKIICNLGFVHVRTKGSHRFFLNSKTGQTTVIPFHGNEEISVGLLKKILRDVNLSDDDFNQLR